MSAPAVVEQATPTHDSSTTRVRSEFRSEIQGLRALAVLLVVLFHLWPDRLSGGFVGVDVFFVISGYLITAHMYREAATTGTLSLRRFWARRIRRLLPASLLVLAISAVATILFLPATVWMMTARQIAASALYVQNWVLAADAVDYMAKDNVPTLAQHYWSLSVEEQFYAFWPLLVLGLIFLTRRTARWRPVGMRQLMIGGFCAAGAVSLAWSVVATANEQSTAYFVTPTRVWEFVAGAITAVVVLPAVRSKVISATVGWLGIGAIVTSAVLFDGESLFPGWIALLPVLGTVAVIVAGAGSSPHTAAWWLSRRGPVFIGDISYSVYLWHWPLIIVFPYVTGVDLRPLDKVGILAATIGLAWLSKIFVEDPMRTLPLLTLRPWRSFALAAAGMAVVVAGSVAITQEVVGRGEAAAVAAEQALAAATGTGCFGPPALDPANGCDPVTGSGRLIPPPEVVVLQNSRPDYAGCQQTITVSAVRVCSIGSDDPRPERTVAVVGDSHATHWLAAFDRLGQTRNWKVLTFVKASCPAMSARRVLPDEQTEEGERSCLAWAESVRRRIVADESISYVFTAAYSHAYDYADDPKRPLKDPEVDGFQDVWKTWVSSGKDVFVIKDIPPTRGDNVPNCLADNSDRRLACATRKADLPPDAAEDAAVAMDEPRVRLIDLTDQFCDDRICYPVVGDLVVYRDVGHLSREYAKALAPYISVQVDRLVATVS
jgi:peptidoglycan/LPS O-acetylase OafA/YrhL